MNTPYPTISAREIQRNYKKVFDEVKKTKQPIVITNQKEPQVAIVSMEDFEKLKQEKYKKSAQNTLHFVREVRELLKEEKLPKDLSINHDTYLWDDEP